MDSRRRGALPRQFSFQPVDIVEQPRRRQPQEIEAECWILVIELLDLLLSDRQNFAVFASPGRRPYVGKIRNEVT
jgi:hypothetical protein